MKEPILTVNDLNVTFTLEGGQYRALQNISFVIHPNEVVGLVGESGCGKSLTSMAIMGILPKHAIVQRGSIQLNQQELIGLNMKQWQKVRGNDLSMIFQEPMTSLNPLLTVGRQIEEVLKRHTTLSKAERKKRTIASMKEVGLPRVEELYTAYPHQLSGGMRQRIVIAMALVGEVDLLIADEPTTALDVTIQAQILGILKSIKRHRHASILFISHDWGVIKEVCDRVLVMYAGQIVEQGPVAQLIHNPRHPYTQGLLLSIPDYKKRGQPLHTIVGRVPGLKERTGGCPFASRCPYVMDHCKTVHPQTIRIGEQQVACHLYEKGETIENATAHEA